MSDSGPDPTQTRGTPGRAEPVDVATVVEIARRYYLDDWSKVALADEYGISRFQVARLLKEARDRGMVRIEISADGIIDVELGARVADALGLREAVVVAATPAQTTGVVLRHLGKGLADLLSRDVAEGQVLGLTWSRVADAAAEQLAHLERCTVVELVGPLYLDGEVVGAGDTARRFAEIGGGEAVPMYTPMILDSAATAAALRSSPEVRDTLAWHDRLDVAVFSIAPWGSEQSRLYRWLPSELRRLGHELGACGEISGRVFRADGTPLPEVIDDRLIGVTLEQMRAARLSVGTSRGRGSVTAIRAAVRMGLIDALVTDSDAAAALLAD
ncbi:sugar-binding domain-containing protein [Amnibacterium sp. CER49]|uniref:sugar-binding transcriptional regulator n=1 Tax=Amnibacterium sp. CER49 TaxID=3039161 RepID=UPI002446EDD7|nr:sugar-binding domain-containing protein [Amnibacterium sp. CER49]MDH2442934.1 sugar-binding domain-containing protein [Amnibacterium sp. CER49]